MLQDPIPWLICLIIVSQFIFYTWLNNSKRYALRDKLTRMAFSTGWIINLAITFGDL